MSKKRLNVEVPENTYKGLKMLALQDGKTLTTYLEELFNSEIKKYSKALAYFEMAQGIVQNIDKESQEQRSESDKRTIDWLLKKWDLALDEGHKHHSDNKIIRCPKKFKALFDENGIDQMDFVLSVLCPIWDEFGSSKFQNLILQDLSSFVHDYYPDYSLSAENLSKNLSGDYDGRGKGRKDSTPSGFVFKIREFEDSGEATLSVYNLGLNYPLPNIYEIRRKSNG